MSKQVTWPYACEVCREYNVFKKAYGCKMCIWCIKDLNVKQPIKCNGNNNRSMSQST